MVMCCWWCCPCRCTDPCGCIFPFIYKNATYNACTTVDDTRTWCMVSPRCANFPLANNSMPPGMRRAYC